MESRRRATMKVNKMNNRNLLVRIDERVNNILQQINEHNNKIDELCTRQVELRTTMKNHVNMHKRDLMIIFSVMGTGLTILTIVLNLVM